MVYNNYYPIQSGHPPPPIQQLQNGCSQIQLMHVSAPQPGMRQVVTPGLQQQAPPPPPQHIGHPMQPQPMPSQHQNYHQVPPHSTMPLSGSPHPQSHPTHNPNLQRPLSRPSTGPSPQQQHLVHQQSPHHIPGPPIHMQQSPQQMVGGPLPPLIPPPAVNQQPPPPHPHNQNFMSPGPMQPGPSPHQYQPQPNHHQPPPPLPQMHPHGPPPPHTYLHPSYAQQPIERGSPFYQHIPQTEFRIIELNKRLQNRPQSRSPILSPLPNAYDESYWWDKFAYDFFDQNATLTLRIAPDDRPVEFTIGRTLIPRFFRSYFEGGVVDLSIKLRNIRETTNHHMITLECDQTDITTKNTFRHHSTNIPINAVVHTEGYLNLEFVSNSYDNLLIKSWRFYTNQCHEYIDRSMTNNGLSSAFLVEPVTRHGLTKSTFRYLNMCMSLEPMQELMFLQRQTNSDPRSCLKQLLHDKYKLKSVDDNRAQPSKRRKRKAPTNTGATGGGTKKGKANNANNAMNNGNNNGNNSNNSTNNNIGFNNIMPPSAGGMPNMSLASQDVMVVGEPSMLGADFGDENERRITRLENNQFDPVSNNNNDNINQNQINISNCGEMK